MENPTDYVIKVYANEADAQNDANALQVDDRNTGAVISFQNSNHFVGFRKYWYRFEFNEPVSGFFVDWDDGDDNSGEKSNSQVVNLDVPNTYGIVSHIYSNSGEFYPLLRAINTENFWSKYYTSNNASNAFKSLETASLSAGQNEKSIVSLDLADSGTSDVRIPYFYPTTLPPVGILKVDRKSVYSGIDNEAVQVNYVYRGGPSCVYAWGSWETDTPTVDKKAEVIVTYETIGGEIKQNTIHTKHANSDISSSENVAIGDVWKILDVKLKKISEHTTKADATSRLLHPQERVYLRWAFIASVQDATNPKLTGQITPSASLTDKVYLKSPSHGVTDNDTLIVTDTTNYNGIWTAESKFTISTFTDLGATVKVTTGTNHGIPNGEVITIAGSSGGAMDGDHTITNVNDATNFEVTTAITPVAGGTPSLTIKNGFHINKDISGGFPGDEGTKGEWSVRSTGFDKSVCNVSTGWPYLKLNERGFFLTADLSESRTRGPNLTIPETAGNLLLDEGKHDWGQQASDLDRATDTLDYSTTVDGTTYNINRLTDYRTQIEYTHDPFQDNTKWTGFRDYTDNRSTGTFRFVDSYRLLRCQVKDDRTDATNDKFAYSEIESFGNYSQADNSTKILPTEVEKEHRIWFTSDSGDDWVEKSSNNRDSSTSMGTFLEQALTSGPLNYFLIANSQRTFDRIFFSSRNKFDNDINAQKGGKCRLSLFYPAYDARRDEIKFRALPFEDYTRTPVADSSLYINGPVVFEAPDNWVKVKYNTSTLVWPDSVKQDATITDWTFDAFAILVGVACEDVSSSTPPDIATIFPYDNDHSEVIKVTDSMHVGLNDIIIAQSLSFNRKGRYIRIDDRIGRSEIRKIGAEGGSIRFGGISFGDYSTAAHTGYDDYELVKKYQQEGTPVYLDLTRPNGEYVRFFGKITNLSEDVPTGRVSEKWGVEMQIEAVAEFNSDGTWISDGFLSLGGVLENEPKYI